MIRSELCTRVRQYLGTAEDDPQFSDTILNPNLQDAYSGLLEDIKKLNPGYLQTSATLAANSTTSRIYTLATQAAPITDFAGWLDIRWTDGDGWPLREVRYDELNNADADAFALSGQDESLVLTTAPFATAGAPLWMAYIQWPAAWTASTDSPDLIPVRYHDVVALEALFVFGLGGEQRVPPELYTRWETRRSQLMESVAQRGVQPSTMRVVR